MTLSISKGGKRKRGRTSLKHVKIRLREPRWIRLSSLPEKKIKS